MSQNELEFLTQLEAIIMDRLQNPHADSYTVSLASSGSRRVAQKVGEEAVELALASVAGDRNEILDEAADLVYHLLVLLNTRGVRLGDVAARLASRNTA